VANKFFNVHNGLVVGPATIDATSGNIVTNSTTTSSSTTTGALTVAGGVGIGGNLYVGGEIVAQKLTIQLTTVTTTLIETDDIIRTVNTTQSSSTTTGALQIAGGAGIGGNLYVGGTIFGTVAATVNTATNANNIATVAQTANANYFPVFVDSNNAASAYELAYTTSSFVINPITGNVGLGISSPGSKLDVDSGGAGVPNVTLRGPSSDNNWAGGIRFISNNTTSVTSQIRVSTNGMLFEYGGSERMRITATGEVGIGTVSPASALHVRAGAGGINAVFESPTTADTRIEFRNSGTRAAYMYWDANEARLLADSSRAITLYTGGIEQVRVNSAGLVGIGTSTATSKLHVNGTTLLTGITTITNTTSASSTITGALQVVGGVGVGGNLYVGGTIFGNATLATTATNLAGGAQGSIPYQSATGTTLFIPIGANGTLLQSNGTTATWVSTGSLIASIANSATMVATVAQTANATYHPTFVDANNASSAYELLYTTSTFAINPATGGIGIGTTSIGDFGATTVTVDAFKSGGALFRARGTNVDAIMQASDTNSALLFGTRGSHSVNFQTNNVERIRITATGDVGVGTVSPAFKVDTSLGTVTNNVSSFGYNIFADAAGNVGYSGYNLSLNNSTGNASGFVRLARTASTVYLGMEIQSQSRDGVRFLTGATTPVEVVRIDASGNVGIGATSPAGILDVRSSSTNAINAYILNTAPYGASNTASSFLNLGKVESGTVQVMGAVSAAPSGTSNSTEGFLSLYTRTVSTLTERIRITNLGNVGIGIIAPESRLHVSGDARITGITTITNTTTASATNTGALQVIGGVGVGGNLYVGGTIFGAVSGTVTNIAGGAQGSIPYQSTTGTTLFIPIGANGTLLQSNGTTATWVSTGSLVASIANSATMVATVLQTANASYFPVFVDTNNATSAFENLHTTSTFSINPATGNVGIGTTTASTRLHVQGSTLIGGDGSLFYDFKLQRLNGGIRAVQHDFAASTNSPWILHGESLSWTGERTGTVESTQAFRPYYEAFAPAVGYKEFGFVNTASGSFTGANLIPSMVLTNTGNVGIGTTSPATKLTIADIDGVTLRISTTSTNITATNYAEVSLSESATVTARWRAYRDGSGKTEFAYNNHLAFASGVATSASERMRIDTNGNVGIGTVSPTTRLDVAGGARITGVTTVTNTTTATSTITGALIVNGGIGVGNNVYIQGALFATTKSFLIDHPTKPGKKLRYGSLEGPENGVYIRGRTQDIVIELPDYWTKLVDPESITVNLTPFGKSRMPSINRIEDNRIYLNKPWFGKIDCYYIVFGERNDIEKLEPEI